MPFDVDKGIIYGPHDLDGSIEYPVEKPTSVFQAVQNLGLDPIEWDRMSGFAFPDRDPEDITVDEVIDKIRDTNCCSGLRYPLEIWVDKLGWFTIEVFKEENSDSY